MKKKGFTMVELIVSIGIICLIGVFLASFITPFFKIFNSNIISSQLKTVTGTLLTEIKNEVDSASEVTIKNTADANYLQELEKPYIRVNEKGEVFFSKKDEQEEKRITKDDFFGYEIRLEFSKNQYGQGGVNSGQKKDKVLFITVNVINEKGSVVQSLTQSCDLPNLLTNIEGGEKGNSICFKMPY